MGMEHGFSILIKYEIAELTKIFGLKKKVEAKAGHRKLHLLYKTLFGNTPK
jgi:hypothetical protein